MSTPKMLELKMQLQELLEKEVYPVKRVSLGSTSSVCKEERWYTQVVYWLQTVEQIHYEEQISFS